MVLKLKKYYSLVETLEYVIALKGNKLRHLTSLKESSGEAVLYC